MNNSDSIKTVIDQLMREAGLRHHGFVPLSRPFSIGLYDDFLREGRAGDMNYLAEHRNLKAAPELLLNPARSAIVAAFPYADSAWEADGRAPAMRPLPALRTALYARQKDYHHQIRYQMAPIVAQLEMLFPGESFRLMVDSSPVLERDLAVRAKLGWIGKNTCLIDRKIGSLFFIAEIISTLSAPSSDWEISDHCGTCTRCLEVCPTGALIAPRKMDARRCISYLNIESRAIPSAELRPLMGDWFLGCDLCQTVCPWNALAHGKERMQDETSAAVTPDHREQDLIWLLTASNRAILKAVQGTPLTRPGSRGLRRNALIVAGNVGGSPKLRQFITKWTSDPYLGELAAWALQEVDSRKESR